MRQCSDTPKGFAANERGVYIPMFVAVIIVVLSFLALVIDIGTVARTRLQLRKATDAGVLAGLAYRLQKGTSADIAEVRRRAKLFAEENLRRIGYPVGSAELTVEEPFYSTTAPETLTVSASYRTPLLLLPYIPMEILGGPRSPDRFLVAAASQGDVPRANIILMMDLSRSMVCPTSDPNCTCANGPAGAPCDLSPDPGVAKVYELRRALYSFIGGFRPGWDRISLVTFDTVADIPISFDRDGDGFADGFDPNDFATVLGQDRKALPAAFSPGGLTNPSDGLLQSYEMLKSVKIPTGGANPPVLLGNEPVTIVYFTDGAPTAQTGCYSNSKPALQPITDLQSCPSAVGKQYVQMEFEYVGSVTGGRMRLLSPLYKRNDLAKLARSNRAPLSFVANSLALPACGAVAPDLMQAVAPCLNDLSSVLPDGTTSQSGEALLQYKSSFYHRPLSLAHYLQRNRVIIYAIGFGPTTNPVIDPRTDLLQDNRDDFHRKDGFLILVANDLKQARSSLKNANGTYPALNYSDFWSIPDRLQADAAGNDFDGDYLAGYVDSEDSSKQGLSQLFGRVAQKILVRLTL